MDDGVRDILCQYRGDLDALDPYKWTAVERWLATVRPFIVEALPRHLPRFDEVTLRPAPILSARIATSRGNNFAQAAETDERANRKIYSDAKAKVLSFLDTLISMPVVTGKAATPQVLHLGSTFNTNITGSTIGAVAVGDNVTASGTVTVHHGALTLLHEVFPQLSEFTALFAICLSP
jgi:hypothetical protein